MYIFIYFCYRWVIGVLYSIKGVGELFFIYTRNGSDTNGGSVGGVDFGWLK